jgi:hypothetical protein
MGRCQILRQGPPKDSWMGDPSPARQSGQNLVCGRKIVRLVSSRLSVPLVLVASLGRG